MLFTCVVVFLCALAFAGLTSAFNAMPEGGPADPPGDKPGDNPGDNPGDKPTDPIVSPSKCVILDPGHGGIDGGASYPGAVEKVINMQIALKVKAYLEEAGFSVIMTREQDITLWPSERVAFAKANAEAELFVSIHCNATTDDVSAGIETWYNSSSNAGNTLLAQCVQDETVFTTGARDRGLKLSTGLPVLSGAPMPSCLIEVGFLSSKNERPLLLSEDYQNKIARGIANGIIAFFSK
ncbi:MAG: N-acetylmuramoyl-L-alanine amidase [Clostridiales bacterium]|nr:N-acetylmuramoyl-L-alanine amidase [Clostridiales bacterium]